MLTVGINSNIMTEPFRVVMELMLLFPVWPAGGGVHSQLTPCVPPLLSLRSSASSISPTQTGSGADKLLTD